MRELRWNGYADEALNVIVGCDNLKCPVRRVCWARRAAKRNKTCVFCRAFRPHFHFERFKQIRNYRDERIIALNFMGDWIGALSVSFPKFSAFLRHLHRAAISKRVLFLTLTKQYEGLGELLEHPYPVDPLDNIWHGITITSQEDLERALPHWNRISPLFRRWISFEPLLGHIDIDFSRLGRVDQVIIGAQTRPTVRVFARWLETLLRWKGADRPPVFIKDNLRQQFKSFGNRFNELAWAGRFEEE